VKPVCDTVKVYYHCRGCCLSMVYVFRAFRVRVVIFTIVCLVNHEELAGIILVMISRIKFGVRTDYDPTVLCQFLSVSSVESLCSLSF
jgi:hypothetical protein